MMDTDAIKLRLREAADVLRRLPSTIGPKEYGSNWPDIVRSTWERWAEGYDWHPKSQNRVLGPAKVRLRPAVPSGAEIDRMDEALGWLKWLGEDEADMVWSRACGITWRSLEDFDGRSRETLRKVCAVGLMVIGKHLGKAARKKSLAHLAKYG